MPRPIECIISIPAMQNNLSVIRQHLNKNNATTQKIWAVIKANAYGHGIERALEGFGAADGLAMLDFAEALRCRAQGWQKPILMLEGFFDSEDIVVLQQHQLQTSIHCVEQLEMLEHTAIQTPLTVWLKINSGMNRLGFKPEQVASAYQRILALQQQRKVAEIGYMTHFANADTDVGIDKALQSFESAIQSLPKHPISIANSATTWRYPTAKQDWMRTGIVLYGSSPFAKQTAQSMQLQATMHLKAKLIAIQTLQVGDTVGYGSQFVADKPMQIGVVACGYADGYPRCAPAGTPAALSGERTQLLGRVSMDMLTIDVTAFPQAKVGDVVELWGDTISIDEVASACNTIAYELMTAVTARVPVRTLRNQSSI